MSNDTKSALFVGGSVDGQVIEIKELQPVLNWYGHDYVRRGTLDTKQYGTISLYILEGMKRQEMSRRLEIIKKVL